MQAVRFGLLVGKMSSMGHRVIRGLVWATKAERPPGFPLRRPRGAKALGLRYEAALARAVPGALHGQWWEFCDAAGKGFCQTDLVLEFEAFTLVLESKYTWTSVGHSQISQLYAPVLELALTKPVVGIVVCKVLTAGLPPDARVFGELGSALVAARRTAAPVVLHWLGKGGLGPWNTNTVPVAHSRLASRPSSHYPALSDL